MNTMNNPFCLGMVGFFSQVPMFASRTCLRKDLISSRAAPGRLVVRPDSGDPKTIVVDVLNRLGKRFG